MFSKIKNFISTLIGKINWTVSAGNTLSTAEINELRQKLKNDHYIILTRHDGHLSTYAIAFAHFVLTGRRGYYTHAFFNVENEVKSDADYKFMEATGKGVHYSTWDEAIDFQTGSIALLKPKSMSIEHWTAIMDRARSELGKPYDTLFDLSNDQALSCVELIRVALQAQPNYATDFANFEALIAKSKNLTPQMFLECADFEVVYEVRN